MTDFAVNHELFKRFRRKAGLTLEQVGRAVGLAASSLSEFEKGKITLRWVHLKDLIRIYRLDVFEIHEALRLNLLNRNYIRDFRRACQLHGLSPGQALDYFMQAFPLIKKTE